jgi:hypothetical protein
MSKQIHVSKLHHFWARWKKWYMIIVSANYDATSCYIIHHNCLFDYTLFGGYIRCVTKPSVTKPSECYWGENNLL